MRSLTRLSPATIAVLATVGVIVLVVVTNGQEMFSPGDLSEHSRTKVNLGGVTSHAEITSCAACHATPASGVTMASLCLDCHGDVKKQIDSRGPMHGRIADANNCRDCHTEHKGSQAPLTNMRSFDHHWTAFKLTGKHAVTDCKACHVNETGFKGVPQNCAACHAEPAVHKKSNFGNNCSDCHSTATWLLSTPTTLADFDHDGCAFKLTGKHTTVDCRSCHLDSTYKGTPQSCVACHAEPKTHAGRFGNDCAKCHSTAMWGGATYTHTIFDINHRRTTLNTCATCHNDAPHYHGYTCYNCHTHTPQNMVTTHLRRNVKNYSQDCISCHGVGKRRGGQAQGEAGEISATSFLPASDDVCSACPASPPAAGLLLPLAKEDSRSVALNVEKQRAPQALGQPKLVDSPLWNFLYIAHRPLDRGSVAALVSGATGERGGKQ